MPFGMRLPHYHDGEIKKNGDMKHLSQASDEQCLELVSLRCVSSWWRHQFARRIEPLHHVQDELQGGPQLVDVGIFFK